MDFDGFAEFSASGDVVPLHGYFNWRANEPDAVFFGTAPFSCPSRRIDRERVVSIHPRNSYKCTLNGETIGFWSGTIFIKRLDSDQSDELFALLDELAAAGSGAEALGPRCSS